MAPFFYARWAILWSNFNGVVCVMGFSSSYQLDLVELTQVITQTDRDGCCDIWYADVVTAGMLCWMMQCGR